MRKHQAISLKILLKKPKRKKTTNKTSSDYVKDWQYTAPVSCLEMVQTRAFVTYRLDYSRVLNTYSFVVIHYNVLGRFPCCANSHAPIGTCLRHGRIPPFHIYGIIFQLQRIY